MNIDTIAGEGATAKGRLEQSLGRATGDPILEREGLSDEAFGGLRKAFGALRDFVRYRPLAAAAIGALIGASLIARSRRR